MMNNGMHFKIVTPNVRSPVARKAGISRPLKAVGKLRDGRLIMVDDAKRIADSSMALFPGYLVPTVEQARTLERLRLDEVVVKYSPEPSDDKILRAERDILLGLPEVAGIPRVIGSGTTMISYMNRRYQVAQGRRPFFVMPRLPGRDLCSYELGWEKGLPARKAVATLAVDILPVLAERLADLHDHGVVHRDVKPNNAIYAEESGQLTLLDFGRANTLTAEARKDVGTFGFYPPELFFKTPEREDVRADVYGLGMTGFSLLSGESFLVLERMVDVSKFSGLDFMWWGRETVMEKYYDELLDHAGLSAGELAMRSNLPTELKQSPIANYIARLFHPDKNKRPANLWQFAKTLRKLGGQLEEHILSL